MAYNHLIIYKKLAHLKENLDNKKDPLALLFLLTISPLKTRVVKTLLLFIFFQFLFSFFLTCFRLISVFDSHVLMKHGSVGGAEFFVLINFGIILVKRRDVIRFNDAFKEVIFSIDEDVIEEKEYKKIMFKVRMIKFIVLLNYALSMTAAFGLISSPEYIRSKSCYEDWILKSFPKYSGIIIFVYHMTFFPVALLLISLSVYAAYIAFGSTFQLVLMNGAIKNICKANIPPMERLESEVYQELIHQKLKVCILFQSLCFKSISVGRDLTYLPIIFFAVGAVTLAGSLLLEIFANDVALMNNRYGVVCCCIVAAVSTGFYTISGQSLKDESERSYFLLLQVPWYYMNIKNRRLYILILMMLEKPIAVSNGLVEVNYALLLQIIKTVYSLAALLLQFVDRTTSSITEP